MSKPACFTASVDVSIAPKMEADLIAQGFEISRPPYTLFSARKKGVSCTLYASGKLTVQGKEMGEFIEFYIEPEVLGAFSFSHPAAEIDKTPRIGMDEAGKGDFFGPLCVAAVFADSAQIEQLIDWKVRDSKQLSDGAICKLAAKIRSQLPYTVIRLFPLKYNELYGKFKNLNRLLGWAHAAALGELSQKTGCKRAILDQFAHPSLVERMLKQKKIEVELTQKTQGESDPVVAAASIVARAAFVEGMEKLSQEAEIELPKGANHRVIGAARELISRFGQEALPRFVKTHFKTAKELG
jgi:ribonuclease HIII